MLHGIKSPHSSTVTLSHKAVVTENILNVILDPGNSSRTWNQIVAVKIILKFSKQERSGKIEVHGKDFLSLT